MEEWIGFSDGIWKREINVRDFIINNYKEYKGEHSFLEDPTEATKQLWAQVMDLTKQESDKGGVLDMGYRYCLDDYITSGWLFK